MFPFPSRNKMSDVPEATPAPAKTPEVHPLDALTGGAFSAPTSGERASRVREWLAGNPTPEQVQEVFKELSVRDKGASKPLRERLDEIKRACRSRSCAATAASAMPLSTYMDSRLDATVGERCLWTDGRHACRLRTYIRRHDEVGAPMESAHPGLNKWQAFETRPM